MNDANPKRRAFFTCAVVVLLLAQPAGTRAEFADLPGALPHEAALKADLQAAWSNRDPAYQPRTEHLDAGGVPLYANRLLLERSPYLRQHAHNPVDWRPWGAEAFAEAMRRDLPILISIGYSTCYWCHVMERESYDDRVTAELVNGQYVAVKVDREVLPEVDDLFVTATEVMGATVGWPLNVFATSDGKPYFAVTYLPNAQFNERLRQVASAWTGRRETLTDLAERIAGAVSDYAALRIPSETIGDQEVRRVVDSAALRQRSFDDFEATGNQFADEPGLFLLLDNAIRNGDHYSASLAEKRLAAIALGGIRDHVGGGFHRYSIDRDWLVPHFEKMLYSQAHLARAYLFAYQAAGNPMFKRVAVQTIEFALREMKDENGAFHSAIDAGEPDFEGEFYLWSVEEIENVLGADGLDLMRRVYGVTEAGNFENSNILALAESPELLARELGIAAGELLARIDASRQQLLEARSGRERPFQDVKALTSWNGMMITTLALAGGILDQPRYVDAAQQVALFLWEAIFERYGELRRVHLDGAASESAKLDDYAYFLQALLAIYDATGERLWLERGEAVAEQMLERFWDGRHGGFFTVSAVDAAGLFARPKEHIDNVLPSGNAVAMESLAKLYRRTGARLYQSRAQQTLDAFSGEIALFPDSFAYALVAMRHIRSGEAGTREFVAQGHAKISVSAKSAGGRRVDASVYIDLEPGWHVNSARPLSANLIPTAVETTSGWAIGRVTYPEAELLKTAFQDDEIAVYSGQVSIGLELERTGEFAEPPFVAVTVQACDDTQCLLPETVTLELPAAGSAS